MTLTELIDALAELTEEDLGVLSEQGKYKTLMAEFVEKANSHEFEREGRSLYGFTWSSHYRDHPDPVNAAQIAAEKLAQRCRSFGFNPEIIRCNERKLLGVEHADFDVFIDGSEEDAIAILYREVD